MKLFERVFLILTLIGLLFVFFGLTGSNEMLMIGLTFFAIWHYALGFALYNNVRLRDIFKRGSYQTIGKYRILGGIGMGLATSVVAIGVLFKLLFLSGAGEMLLIGVGVDVILISIAFATFKIKQKTFDSFYRNVFSRGLLGILFGTLLLFTTQRSLVKFYYRNEPVILEKYLYVLDHPTDDRAQQELEEAIEKR